MALRIALVVLLASSCAPERSIVSDGPLQKRRSRPGWHWDFPASRKEPHTRSGTSEEARPARAHITAPVPAPVTAEPVAHVSDGAYPNGAPALPHTHGDPHKVVRPAEVAPPAAATGTPRYTQATRQVPEQSDRTDPPAKKRWNPWAAPALAVALGTVAIGLFTTSTIAVLFGVAVAIVLAAIALRRGRQEELSGKGMAIVAMIVCMLTVLATAAVIMLRGGL